MGSCDLWRSDRASSYRSRRGGTGTPSDEGMVSEMEGVAVVVCVGEAVGDGDSLDGTGGGTSVVASGVAGGVAGVGVVAGEASVGPGAPAGIVVDGTAASRVGVRSLSQATSSTSASRTAHANGRTVENLLAMAIRPGCRHQFFAYVLRGQSLPRNYTPPASGQIAGGGKSRCCAKLPLVSFAGIVKLLSVRFNL